MLKRRLVHVVLLALLLLPGAIRADTAKVDKVAPSLDTLKATERRVEQVVAKVLPCTVCVRSATRRGAGSGVVVSEDGLVLTAAHVTRAAGNDLVVIFPDGREVKAKALGANRTRDAAMVQILENGKYAFAEVGKSADLKPNQWCIALGHAGGFDPRRTPPVRWGRIVNNGRFIMTDCTLIGGDSGGPLFDLDGRVIGIHSNIGGALWQNNHVPIDAFHASWDRMLGGETWGRLPGRGMDPNRPMLGVQFDTNPSPGGCAIRQVVPGSPAEKAGLKAGDVVWQVDGKDVKSARDIVVLLRAKKPGQRVTLKARRGDESIDVAVTLIRARDLGNPPSPVPPAKNEKNQPRDKKGAGKAGPKKGEPPKNSPDAARKKTADKAVSPAAQGAAKKKNKSAKKQSEPESKPAPKANERLDMRELMRRARQNGGRLRLTPQQYRQFQQELARRRQRGRGKSPRNPPGDNAWVKQVFSAYQSAIEPARKSVAAVLVDGKRVAFATAVSSDGTLVTKASTIAGKEFQIGLGGDRHVAGKLVKISKDYDVALIRADTDTLVPIKWATDTPALQLGEFVAAVGKQAEPAAIGVVSVLTRNLDEKKQGYLGVQTVTSEKGIRLVRVQSDTPAARAGLLKGDVVVSIGGTHARSTAQFAKLIAQHKPDSKVVLKILRGDKEINKTVTLADRSSLAVMPGQQQMMNRLGTRLSKKRSGFKRALQHDCPIEPEDCGGPLVDLDGDVVGINIARAGRIKSYAIPADAIRKMLQTP